MLCDALSNNSFFGLPSVEGKTIYLCEPISPYYINGDGLQKNGDIEYDLIRADMDYIACVTVCYQNGQFATASFGTDVALALEGLDVGTSNVLLVSSDGSLYIKMENGTTKWSSSETIERNENSNTVSEEADTVCAQLESIQCNLSAISVKGVLNLPTATPVTPRYSKILNVEYVPQNGMDICWAAAAASLGRFHTNNEYSNYSALELINAMGASVTGGTMADSIELMRRFFDYEALYYDGQLSGVVINQLNSYKPILAGFFCEDTEIGHMVVICGFDYPGVGYDMKYYIRDPNSSAIQIVSAPYDETLILDYYTAQTGPMSWCETAY